MTIDSIVSLEHVHRHHREIGSMRDDLLLSLYLIFTRENVAVYLVQKQTMIERRNDNEDK